MAYGTQAIPGFYPIESPVALFAQNESPVDLFTALITPSPGEDKNGSVDDRPSQKSSGKNENGSVANDPDIFRKNMFGLDNLSYHSSKISHGNGSQNNEKI